MLNQCNFIGRLGQDCTIRYSQTGTAVSNFSLACSEKWKSKSGEQQSHTEWIKVIAWGKLAEIMTEYCHKGDLVFISGKIQTKKWENQDGVTQYTTECIAREMKMLGGKGDRQEKPSEPPMPEPAENEGIDDDVPF